VDPEDRAGGGSEGSLEAMHPVEVQGQSPPPARRSGGEAPPQNLEY